MTENHSAALRDRLARLDSEQVVKLVTGLQSRIDTLRAGARRQSAPIAVIGMGCRFPGAPGVEAFRALLDGAGNAVGAAPADRPERAALPMGGYIDAIDRFDAGFFGIRDSEAAHMDPQHRIVLEVAWHALEDAGAADARRRPSATGVFLGISTHDYEARFHAGEPGFTPQATTGNAASAAAGRLAHLLDVTGPALSVDTACSSSLVAVLAACRSLQRGETDMAIAGGVNMLVNDAWTRGFASAGMLSPSHACRTFDAGADGYVRGEGAGVIVLKRLDDARRDGDRIRAVIRGGAVNHDGRASSLTAPNASAQASLIEAALADAGLAPADVQAVECHGTGTALGDPIEVQALARAYAPGREAPLLLGAVKTNIGHLEAAAGIAGLIKTILALESSSLPATLHQRAPNPRIAWDSLPVRVVDHTQPWPEVPVRRAGVSSFGFSGTNAHIVLESAEPASAPGRFFPAALPLSAPDEAGLGRLAGTLAGWIEAGRADLSGAAASLSIGRGHFPVRAAVAAGDRDAAVAGLRDIAALRAPTAGARATAPPVPPKIAFLFTGQGSQWAGMGKDLYEGDPVFRNAVDQCARIVDPLIGKSLTAVMFDGDAPDDLSDTRLTQPALFALEYALAELLSAWGVEPDVMIGHSLGEWTAACRAGVFALDDALRLVVERGRAMASASDDGAMAAVFAGPEVLEALPRALRDGVDLAAVNAFDECVISGPADAVAAVCEALDAQEVGTQRLRTSHGFHSRLMDPALAVFDKALAGTAVSAPKLSLVSNLTGTLDAPFDTAGYWVRHIRQPVRFADGMAAVAASGAGVLIEVGAAPALIASASRCPAFQDCAPAMVPTLRRNHPARRTLGNLLAQLFVAGVPLRWDRIFDPALRIRIPGYPFAGNRHWLPYAAAPSASAGGLAEIAPDTATAPVAREAPAGVREAENPADARAEAVDLLARLLQLSRDDAESDTGFLELGVDSLALTESVAALERRWSMAIPRRALFEELSTPARLVGHIVANAEGTNDPAPGPAVSAPHSSAATGVPAPVAAVPAAAAMPANTPDAPPAPPPAAAKPFSAEMAAGVAAFAKTYTERTRASGDQRRQYGRNLADSRAVAGFRPETKGMLYPIVGARGAGSRMTDVDGNQYVDIAMGFGVQLFGHTPPFLADAIVKHVSTRGLFIGPQAHLAGEVAQRLCRLTGNARVTFCNSGTEAVMTALRLARHATRRTRIAMFQGSYHGHFDGTLAQLGAGGAAIPLAGGTPRGMVDDVLLLDYGDEAGSLEILAREAGSLAAVIVEPVQGRRPDRQPREFLQRLRALTRQAGAALIFDEVLLGFRVALGGAQAWAGVRADLVTYGKIVGGGLPIGLVAGEPRFLDALDGGAWSLDDDSLPGADRTFFAGTFNKNPLAMANAKAVLEHLEAAGPQLQESLNQRTQRFAGRLNAVLAEEESGISVHQFSSLFRFVGASDLFYNHMIHNGVYVWEGRTCFLSTAHTDEDLHVIERAVRASVRAMRAAGLLARARQPAGSSGGPEALPTTPGQEALRLLAAFSPETSAAYNQSLVFDFSGDLNPDALACALRGVVDRHEALRTTFPEDGATQLVHRRLDPDIRTVDYGGQDEAAFRAWLDDTVLAPLDLERGPLVVARILKMAAAHHRLVLIMPHLITDGWSMQLIASELAALYNSACTGGAPELAAPVPYRKYAQATRERASLPEYAGYWKSVYGTVPEPLRLPADRPRPRLQGYAGRRASKRLAPSVRQALEACARRAGSSLFSLCLSAYGRLLARLSGQDDLAVAIFSAGQPELGTSALAGYCVGVLPVRLNAAASQADADYVKSVQHAVAAGMAHRDYPFPWLIRELGIKRDPSRAPLASVSFNLDRLDPPPDFHGLATVVDANAHSAVRWDLNWNVQVDAQGLRIDAHYNRALFDAGRIEQWLDGYAAILDAMIDSLGEASAAGSPRAVAMKEGAGKQSIGKQSAGTERAGTESPGTENAGGAPGPDTSHAEAGRARRLETLAERVSEAARRAPHAPAVRDADGVTDYATLEAEVDVLAGRLAQAGIGPGDRVAFRLERGLGPVVAILAAGRLGAAFVPLDTEHPDGHHAYVIEDSGACAVIVDAGASAPASRAAVLHWAPARNGAPGRVPGAAACAPARVAADDIAYVLYTSGSTGTPKGVRVPCEAVAAYATAMLERLAVPAPASFAIVSSFAADLGYTCVLGALWTGGTLHAIDARTARDPAALQAWSRRAPIDVLKIVPAHLGALLDAPDAADLLPRKALILGGDTLSWSLVDRIRALGAGCRVFNHYGPTEATVGACMGEAADALRDESAAAVPIGRPLSGYRVDILDAGGRPVPDGQEGEIVIAGAAVAAGYTRPEAQGDARFGAAGGMRRYRTGDLGWRRADGAIVFTGRRDDMVKVRGHRVEPAGLAELLRSCPGVRDAVVLAEHQDGREPALLAAVAGEAAAGDVTAWLAERVPAALVPAKVVALERLPLTANGKIDRQALRRAAEQSSGPAASTATAPGGDTAGAAAGADGVRILQDLWRDILRQPAVGPDDDFFALGGDSIMAIQIVGRARAAGLGLTPSQVFEAPTPRGLARLAVPVGQAVAGAREVAGPLPLTPIQQWFMETPMPHRNRWCLSAVFATALSVDAARLQEVVQAIVARHDALRMRWRLSGGPVRQSVGAAAAPTVLAVDCDGRCDAELRQAEDDLADRLIDTLDLESGRMLAAGVVRRADAPETRIVVVAHHAATDMVSWSILADDLETGLSAGPSGIRPASTSWSWWARAQSERVGAVADRIPYWSRIAREAREAGAPPVDQPGNPNFEGDVRERRLHLDAGAAGRFFADMASVFGMRAHEALLAAVGAGLAEWTGSPPAIELEGHGRQAFDASIDLSRTVGWFTTRFPVVLPAMGKPEDPSGWLVAVKETMRAIPDEGMSYGMLRYGGGASLEADPAVSFNFVGDLGQFGARDVSLLRLGAGRERSADAGRRHLLAFDAWQTGEGLFLSCRYGARHAAATIDAVLAGIERQAVRFTQACTASSAAVYTPSDFTGMDFSQDELDQLMGDFDPGSEDGDPGDLVARSPDSTDR